jgi:hypothetical protein
MSQSQQLADCYQALFNHLAQEYDLNLTISEMDEIIRLSLATVEKINALAEGSLETIGREIAEMPDKEFEQNCNAIEEMAKHTKHPPSFRRQIMDTYNQGYRDGHQDATSGTASDMDISKYPDAAHYWQRTYGTNVPTETP